MIVKGIDSRWAWSVYNANGARVLGGKGDSILHAELLCDIALHKMLEAFEGSEALELGWETRHIVDVNGQPFESFALRDGRSCLRAIVRQSPPSSAWSERWVWHALSGDGVELEGGRAHDDVDAQLFAQLAIDTHEKKRLRELEGQARVELEAKLRQLDTALREDT